MIQGIYFCVNCVRKILSHFPVCFVKIHDGQINFIIIAFVTNGIYQVLLAAINVNIIAVFNIKASLQQNLMVCSYKWLFYLHVL